jgi:hypothetical protein
MRRFDMRLPVIVRLLETKSDGITPDETNGGETNTDGPNQEPATEFHTETMNVSARGVYFYLDRAIATGTKLEVTLTFPPHITLTDAVRVRFSARVIRVESPLPSRRIGTAAMIENYEFLRSNGATDFLAAWQNAMKGTN